MVDPKPISDFAKEGSDLYAQIETALDVAMRGLHKLSKMHIDAYQHGYQKDIEAITASNNAISLRGDLAALTNEVYSLHQADTARLKAAGGAPVGPYKALPPMLIPQPKSGGR